MGELLATIVGLCRFGEDFDDQRWVQQRIEVAVFKQRFATHRSDVGIRIESRRRYFRSHFKGIQLARFVLELKSKFDREVRRDLRVLSAGSRHQVGFSVDVLASHFGFALELQILLGRNPASGLSRHFVIHDGGLNIPCERVSHLPPTEQLLFQLALRDYDGDFRI